MIEIAALPLACEPSQVWFLPELLDPLVALTQKRSWDDGLHLSSVPERNTICALNGVKIKLRLINFGRILDLVHCVLSWHDNFYGIWLMRLVQGSYKLHVCKTYINIQIYSYSALEWEWNRTRKTAIDTTHIQQQRDLDFQVSLM